MNFKTVLKRIVELNNNSTLIRHIAHELLFNYASFKIAIQHREAIYRSLRNGNEVELAREFKRNMNKWELEVN